MYKTFDWLEPGANHKVHYRIGNKARAICGYEAREWASKTWLNYEHPLGRYSNVCFRCVAIAAAKGKTCL